MGTRRCGRARLRTRQQERSLRWLHALAVRWRERSRPKSGLGVAGGYLRDVLFRLPAMTTRDDLEALTPRRWQPASSSAS